MSMIDLELGKKLEAAAEILSKSAQTPEIIEEDETINVLKSMGAERAKAAIQDLTEEELEALDESLQKAVTLDAKVRKQPKKIKQNASEEVDATQESSRGEDEEIVPKQAEAAVVRHQGGTGDDGAWEGQVIKAEEESTEVKLEKGDLPPMMDESEEASKKSKKPPKDHVWQGDSKDGLKGSDAENPKAEGAQMQKAKDMPAMMENDDESGKKAKADDKPMSSKVGPKVKGQKGRKPLSVAPQEKLAEDDKPISGKSKKAAQPQPNAERAKAQMSKSEGTETDLQSIVDRMKQRDLDKDTCVKALTERTEFGEEEILKAWDIQAKELEKSIKWGVSNTQRLLGASIRRGQNATYQSDALIAKSYAEQEAGEKLHKSEGYRWKTGETEEKLEKSERPVDINDFIEKGADMSPEQVKIQAERVIQKAAHFNQASFSDADMAWACHMDKKKAEDVLGEPLRANKPKKD